jgi:mRNA interferase MazF
VAKSFGKKHVYVPDRGDIVWVEFDPQSGSEQAGLRPAITLSPKLYNEKTGLGLFCPITTSIKGYPFETMLPNTCPIRGAVLADHVKNMDWRSRKAKFILAIDDHTLDDVANKVALLLGLKPSSAPF